MSPKNRLNPDAGDVPIPEDPREVEAALRAGRVSWRLFPYYRWRYGDRGAAFTRSDSAWLVTLCGGSQRHVEEQIDWLGTVLSNRGMPRWLLETHLRILYRSLARTLPDERARYEKLMTASTVLGNARRRVISDEDFERLARDFSALVGMPGSHWMEGTGRLLVAAVADEKNGMKHAVSSLENWLADPARFDEARRGDVETSLRKLVEELTPARWTDAIHQTIAAARQG